MQKPLSCEGGKNNVNINHELELANTTAHTLPSKPACSDVLNNNVSMSQLNRLQMRAIARAEKAKKETKEPKKLQKIQKEN